MPDEDCLTQKLEELTPREKRSALERQATSIIAALILAGVLWLGNSAINATKSLTEMVHKIELLKVEIKSLNDKLADTYTITAANANNRIFNLEITQLKLRVEKLENK